MAISVLSQNYQNFGSQSGAVGQVQLDSSYPTGGYPLPATSFGLTVINSFLATTTGAELLFYNYTTQKLMVFTAAGGAGGTTGATTATNSPSAVTVLTPDILSTITGEAVVVNPGTGTAAAVVGAPTAIFNAVRVTASGVGPGNFTIVATGVPLASGQCSINYTTGVVQFLAADAVTAATVDYVQRGVSGWTGNAAAQIQAPHTHTYGGIAGGIVEVTAATDLHTVVGNYILLGN